SEDLVKPLTNLQLGSWYIGYLNKRFNGNTLAIIASYNAGQNKVAEWLNDGTWDGSEDGMDGIPYGETRHYLQKVIFYHDRYERIYK
ncbi:MAG: transglycosylase SLT domain-containing protein, partial [Bacilli bacterium]